MVALGLALGACTSAQSRDFHSYYDPQGLFSTYLPLGNDVTVASPQPNPTGPSVVAGVVSQPPQPTPSPQQLGGFGQGFGQQAAPEDQTIYEVFVVTTDTFSSVGDMALFFLTSDPSIDVRSEEATSIAGHHGKLVVADIVDGGEAVTSLAAAFTIGEEGQGYLVAALFPPGDWDRERSDFLRVVDSFRTDVPPAITTVPLSGGSA